jgi:transaldolase
MPAPGYLYDAGTLKPIPYQDLSLERPWHEYDIRHELTDKGMERFSADWNALIATDLKKTA